MKNAWLFTAWFAVRELFEICSSWPRIQLTSVILIYCDFKLLDKKQFEFNNGLTICDDFSFITNHAMDALSKLHAFSPWESAFWFFLLACRHHADRVGGDEPSAPRDASDAADDQSAEVPGSGTRSAEALVSDVRWLCSVRRRSSHIGQSFITLLLIVKFSIIFKKMQEMWDVIFQRN